jgi:hypothetical protein
MERIGEDVRGSLRSAGVPDAGVLAAVTRVWPDAVGPGIAAAAWPARIGRDETLHVATASSVWAFELTRLEDEILGRLRDALAGEAAPPRIRFAAGPVPEPPRAPDAPEPLEPPAPAPEELREAERLAAPIEDERLRVLAARAVAASLRSRRDDRSF